jgi:hypothetical protein
MFGVNVHILPAGYRYHLKDREPIEPKLTKLAGVDAEV